MLHLEIDTEILIAEEERLQEITLVFFMYTLGLLLQFERRVMKLFDHRSSYNDRDEVEIPGCS
jgi:hypothetical protein